MVLCIQKYFFLGLVNDFTWEQISIFDFVEVNQIWFLVSKYMLASVKLMRLSIVIFYPGLLALAVTL